MSEARMNPQQMLAVNTLSGPLLLLAGAGTGKTTVIVQRIANLVAHGIAGNAILAVTFTNKAAKEMRERVAEKLRLPEERLPTVSTFHAFCAAVLRRHIHHLGFTRNFTIASESYQSGLIREIMTDEGVIAQGCSPGDWQFRLSKAKSALQSPADVAAHEWPQAAAFSRLYARYQRRLQQMDMLDFDDMLLHTVRLWEEFPAVLQLYHERYSHFLVDEYQDTNSVQLRLMLLLSGKTRNLAVVGDDDQSIYGWRGANLGNILEFEHDFPEARVIRLEQNYRSTNIILRAANAVIARNRSRREKSLWSARGDGEKISGVLCADGQAEAQFVASYIRSEAGQGNWGDFAVLFRSNHQARLLEERLRADKVPYVLVGANSFYQSKEILDAVSLLNMVANPRDDMSFLRVVNVPPRGLGESSVETLRQLQRQSGQPLQALACQRGTAEHLCAEAGAGLQRLAGHLQAARDRFSHPGGLYAKAKLFFEEVDYLNGLGRMYKPREDALKRRDNVLEFLNSLAEYDESRHGGAMLQEFLESYALLDGNDRREKSPQASGAMVTLMTVHAAKGLEFPWVVLTGMERNLFPHQRALEEGNEEEERRLFYVAITRAKHKLVITYAEKRRTHGTVIPVRPSKFLDEIPASFIDYVPPASMLRTCSREENSMNFQALLDQLSTEPPA